MTYKELLHFLEDLDDDQLNLEVMAHVDEEFFPVTSVLTYDDGDQLDREHPYVQVE